MLSQDLQQTIVRRWFRADARAAVERVHREWCVNRNDTMVSVHSPAFDFMFAWMPDCWYMWKKERDFCGSHMIAQHREQTRFHLHNLKPEKTRKKPNDAVVAK